MSDVHVTIRIDGSTHAFHMDRTGRSILDAAEGAGIVLPWQCRAGICATCRARLRSGEVRLIENMVLDEEELAAGFVLACQAVPLSDEVSLDFDAA